MILLFLLSVTLTLSEDCGGGEYNDNSISNVFVSDSTILLERLNDNKYISLSTDLSVISANRVPVENVLAFPEKFKDIISTQKSFLGVTPSGGITAWGDVAHGGGIYPTTQNIVKYTASMNSFSVLDINGEFTSWGGSGLLQYSDVIDIVSSRFSPTSACLFGNNTVAVWGNESCGNRKFTDITLKTSRGLYDSDCYHNMDTMSVVSGHIPHSVKLAEAIFANNLFVFRTSTGSLGVMNASKYFQFHPDAITHPVEFTTNSDIIVVAYKEDVYYVTKTHQQLKKVSKVSNFCTLPGTIVISTTAGDIMAFGDIPIMNGLTIESTPPVQVACTNTEFCYIGGDGRVGGSNVLPNNTWWIQGVVSLKSNPSSFIAILEDGSTAIWGTVYKRIFPMCTKCPMNQFSATSTNVKCTACDQYSWSKQGSTECRNCPLAVCDSSYVAVAATCSFLLTIVLLLLWYCCEDVVMEDEV